MKEKSNFWTARGKTFVSSVEDICRYLSAIFEAQQTLNSKIYVLMKLYPFMVPYLVMKMSNFTQRREIALKCPPMCAARGKSFWSWRFTPVCTSASNFMTLSCRFTKLRSYEIPVQVPPSQLFKIFNRWLWAVRVIMIRSFLEKWLRSG